MLVAQRARASRARAGPRSDCRTAYSEGAAKVTASRLLRHPEVSAVVQRARRATMERVEASAERVIEETAPSGFR